MGRWDAVWKRLVPGRWTSVVALLGVVAFFLVSWLFGWWYPARSDLEGLLHVAFISNGSLGAFAEDGRELTLDQAAVSAIGDIRCESESTRRQPTIHYRCLYELSGNAGQRYRLVLAADHNRGWQRMDMADYGNYRLVYVSPEQQRAVLQRLASQ